jgi:hypothetical protein
MPHRLIKSACTSAGGRREPDDVHPVLASKQGSNSIAYDAVIVDYYNASKRE